MIVWKISNPRVAASLSTVTSPSAVIQSPPWDTSVLCQIMMLKIRFLSCSAAPKRVGESGFTAWVKNSVVAT